MSPEAKAFLIRNLAVRLQRMDAPIDPPETLDGDDLSLLKLIEAIIGRVEQLQGASPRPSLK